MSEERIIYVHDRNRTPLAMRTRFAWTFFGLGLFAAINLSLVGAYILAEAVREPLSGSGNVIVAGGFMVALAGFLLVYLIWPRAKALFVSHPELEMRRNAAAPMLTIYAETLELTSTGDDVPALPQARAAAAARGGPLVRHARERTGSVPQSQYGDGARARQ